ncbi:T9SS type A sorting domain-containing protein [Candidatus Latescibacterota bacterium]
MSSKRLIFIILLLMIGLAGQSLAATITATPSNVPKGAYVDGPGGLTDDNMFFQTVVLTSGDAHVGGTVKIVLPEGMTIPDVAGGGYADEISFVATVANITVSAATINDITLGIGAAGFAAGQSITIMFPVVTENSPADSTQDYTVEFSLIGADDVLDGSGFFVTYVDPGPNTIGLVSFLDNLSADDDSTNGRGDRYPSTAANTHDQLPDLIFDALAANSIESVNSVAIGYDLSQVADAGTETKYTIWVSADSTLAHVDSLTSGVFHALEYGTLAVYNEDEGDWGGVRYDLSGYPAGEYYFYLTSYVTGDFPLARSGKLTVTHYPVINAVGWDYDHQLGYVPGAGGGQDDITVTLDSGDYLNYAGAPATAGHYTFLDIYANVDDLDDNAEIQLYYSSTAGLDTSLVERTGSSADGTLAVTGLTGATLITDGLLENAEDAQGYVKYRWSMDPDTTGVHTAGSLTVYCITVDGKNFDLSPVEGSTIVGGEIVSAGLTLTTEIKNSPKLQLDVLDEYDSDQGGDDIDINVDEHDVIMISWAKNGAGGDLDIDDSAQIELYIVDDDPANITYGSGDATALRDASVLTPTTHHLITSGLMEDYESKEESWYAWDLKADSGWSPNPAADYVLYGIIDDQRATPTAIVTSILTTGATFITAGDDISAAGDGQEIRFTNNPYGRLSDPPAEGVTINAEETYRVKFNAFDWDSDAEVAIYIVKTTAAGFAEGPLVKTQADLVAELIDNAWCLTDDDGDEANGTTAYLSENSDSYYDIQIRVPGAALPKYDDSMVAGVDAGVTGVLDNGEYWVYIGVGDGAIAGGTPIYRAPGKLNIVNADNPAVLRNLTVSPMDVTVAQGDTVDFSIKGLIAAVGSVDRIDAYIAVEKEWWDVVSPSTPFTAGGTFIGKLIANAVIDDVPGDRWILRTVVSDAGATTQFDLLPTTGLGTDVATFRLVSKGTTDALPHNTSVYFVTDAGSGWKTQFSLLGADYTINSLGCSAKVGPRGIIEGIVELQGRTQMDTKMTFELRERGGYNNVTDSLLYATNDADPDTSGIQFTPDADGKFTLLQVPTGEFDLVVKHDRYLAELVQVDIAPGLDTLFVNFDELKGGDAVGYTDSLGYSYPNNKIDGFDINRIQTAFLATNLSDEWNDGENNWKWADINEDFVVEVDDLSMATGNSVSSGAQPVFLKPAAGEEFPNEVAMVNFDNVPSQLKAGETYTIQVVGHDFNDARAYFVNLNFDKQALTFTGIVKGDFINSDSFSFPVIGEETVGLANSVFGASGFSGSGVLAEVQFTANFDGIFTADMLSFEKASVVNSYFLREDIIGESITIVDSGDIPSEFALVQNFPNPFNPSTTIEFSVPQSGHVSIMIYDILGRNVKTLVSDVYDAGNHSAVWNATDMNGNLVANGVYFYTIEAGNFHTSRRMMFMK